MEQALTKDGGVMKTVLRAAPGDAAGPSKDDYVCEGVPLIR